MEHFVVRICSDSGRKLRRSRVTTIRHVKVSRWMSAFIDRVLIFFLLRRFFVLRCCQVATCCLETVSALVPIAQIKPSNSQATAVTIFLWSLPAAPGFKYRLCSLCCAFHAISLVSSEMLSPVVFADRTRYLADDDSSMRLRQRCVAGARCRSS
jgi:hypothetical protein